MCQKDLHYNSILALCIRAGYTPEEAKIIAWSNYQCDCTALTQVKRPWQLWGKRNPGPYYHFVDRDEIRHYLHLLLNEQTRFPGAEKSDYYFIALGISLHAFQDSYSHEGFVGKCDKRNEMGLKTPWWRRLIPQYGHSQMLEIPDRCEATWFDSRISESINNRRRFEVALRTTFALLTNSDSATTDRIDDIVNVLWTAEYDSRKAEWSKLANLPGIRFSEETKTMWPKHKKAFVAAAKRQKEFLS